MERFFFERVGVCGNKGIAGAVGKRVCFGNGVNGFNKKADVYVCFFVVY